MNVLVKREVTGVLVYLPAGEAEEFLRNPKKAQSEVAAMLRGTASLGQDDQASMARLVIGDRASLALPAPKGKAFRNYPKGSRKPGRGGGRNIAGPGGRKNCPICGKPVKSLAIHMGRMHKEGVAAAAQARRDFAAEGNMA